ncbi:MAG: tetratricopeptide repeat protein [Armatimonadetes bacterium]|nr:tetratricopeptide repeat protein [Armatimonadota bacterium]
MSDRLPDLDELWDFENPAETESRFRKVLPDASDDPAYAAELLSQIARAEGLQQKFKEAHDTLDEAERLSNETMVRARVRCLLERGRVYNSSGSPERARPFFLEALSLAERGGEENLAVDAAHMMAIIESSGSRLEWNLRAVKIAENSKDEKAKRWLGSLYNNIGWTYHDAGEFEKALEFFKMALEYREARGKARPIQIAKWCVARCMRSLGRVEEAFEAHKSLAAELEESGAGDGYVFEELGECLLALNREAESKPFFAKAHEELSKDPWLSKNEPERIERLRSLSGGGP